MFDAPTSTPRGERDMRLLDLPKKFCLKKIKITQTD